MFPAKELSEEEFLTFIRGKIVAIAQAIVDEEIGIISGSRKLSEYGSKLYTIKTENLDEEYFIPFRGVESETIHLPVDWGRKNWSEDALRRKDAEISKFEAQVNDRIFEACRVLIERYGV